MIMIEVAVGILKRENKILLCQRLSTARYPLKWEFPGGKLETNETEDECLRRELEEELSIIVRSSREYHSQAIYYPDSGNFNVKYFVVDEFSGEPRNNGFANICWIALNELELFDVLEGNREVIKLLLNDGG